MIADCAALSGSVGLVASSQPGGGLMLRVADCIGPDNKGFKFVDHIKQAASLLTCNIPHGDLQMLPVRAPFLVAS